MKPFKIKYKIFRIVLSACFFITSSCTMLNPHIEIEGRPEHSVSLSEAIEYANKGKDKYTDALGEQAKFNSYLGIGLTALGAAALGLGMTGGSATAITVLGLTGASAYGVGSFLENKPRQRAYILGYNALNCAVEAILPLQIELNSYHSFIGALRGRTSISERLIAQQEINDWINRKEKELNKVNATEISDKDNKMLVACLDATRKVVGNAAEGIIAESIASFNLDDQLKTLENNTCKVEKNNEFPKAYTMQQQAKIIAKKAVNNAPTQSTMMMTAENFDSGILKSIKETEKAINNIEQASYEKTSEITGSLDAAKSLVETAKIAYNNGVSLDLKIQKSGYMLITAVDRIIGRVNETIVNSQTDLQSIMAIIGGLGGVYSQFTTVPQSLSSASDIVSASDSGITEAGGSKEEKKLSDDLDKLRTSVAELSLSTQKVTAFVNAVVDETPVEQLKLCGVNPEDIASNIEVEPAGVINFTFGEGGSKGRIIQGGTSPYSVTMTASATNDIIVKQLVPFAPMFVVEATTEAEPRSYAIYITDGSGHSKFVEVRVNSKSGTPSKETNSSTGAQACNSAPTAWKNLDISSRKKVQRALCTKDDGLWGCNTHQKLNEFKKSITPSNDSNAVEILEKLTPAEIQKQCGTIVVPI